jgi:hypothetical protein
LARPQPFKKSNNSRLLAAAQPQRQGRILILFGADQRRRLLEGEAADRCKSQARDAGAGSSLK